MSTAKSASSSADRNHIATDDSSQDEPAAEYAYLTGIALYNLMGATMLSVLLLGLDTNVVATAIPTISDHFGTVTDVSWYGSALLVAM